MASKSLPVLGLEREYGEKIDRCISDTLLKAGAGLLVGGVFSFALFKRRAWPVTLGTGIGLGIAYRNCEDNMRIHYTKKIENDSPALFENVPKVNTFEPVNSEPCQDCEREGKSIEIDLDATKKMVETLIPMSTVDNGDTE